jgi:hypothetical protein
MNEIKSGMPYSGLNNNEMMTWRCVAIVGFDALFFCKIVARWVYINTRERTEHGIADFISFMRERNPVF